MNGYLSEGVCDDGPDGVCDVVCDVVYDVR